ncbi:MAG: hypothetical protein SPH68_08290 [Candidatus Borkfalkiaceae bacterium]|nr:hypothetical protein [Clostridia bacterium]MDY6224138.1 hypothetical protein [Christensenellaceae bacterium]
MEKIRVSKDGRPDECIAYVSEKVGGRFSALPCSAGVFCRAGRSAIEFSTEKIYEPYVRGETVSAVAEVLALFYKYRFFSRLLPLPALTKEERELLLTALVSADFSADKEYVKRRLSGLDEYRIDGVFFFRLQELKKSWERIASYVPASFSGEALFSFVKYLVSEGEGRVFLQGESAYDEDYRPLKKSSLIGGYSAPKEILLSSARFVYCFGGQSQDTREFLKKYYPERTFFC